MRLIDLPYQPDLTDWSLKLGHLEGFVWLDSGKPGSHSGQYDIISALPSDVVHQSDLAFVQRLTHKLESARITSDLPFTGGWIGFFSYAHHHDTLKLSTHTDHPFSRKSQFGWYDWAIINDHKLQKCTFMIRGTCDESRVASISQLLYSPPTSKPLDFKCSLFAPCISKHNYMDAFQLIKDYLYAGDAYQINYTQQFSAQFSGSALAAYLNLRTAVPSPFSAFIQLPDGAVLSISPERFISIRDSHCITEPIKGTCARGLTPHEDHTLKQALFKCQKNRAENVMIVDLLRNDFSKLCLPNSVRTTKLFEIQTFSNVHHLVSRIEGQLAPKITHPEFILNCFPGGSITGAPKLRAMEIINEIEPFSRSLYCGSIGYFSSNHNSDFNIAIRTLDIQASSIKAWAGGGITVDSDVEQEFEECYLKIRALLTSLSGLDATEHIQPTIKQT